jgi:FHS family L-fucose permease-like MFS transporter
LNYQSDQIAPYVSLFWASLMIGRWTGSVGAFSLKMPWKRVLQFLMPYIAFSVFLLINIIAGKPIEVFYPYFAVILVLISGDILSKGDPARQLLIYSLLGIVALFVGMLSSGYLSVFAFISVGLFCSTLWPCIFTLAISGLGKHTNEGSGFLIMMIMGGGFISLLQGVLAEDALLGIQWSYLVGVLCFAYLAYYAFRFKSLSEKSSTVASGH